MLCKHPFQKRTYPPKNRDFHGKPSVYAFFFLSHSRLSRIINTSKSDSRPI
jgi:hypothetical protein